MSVGVPARGIGRVAVPSVNWVWRWYRLMLDHAPLDEEVGGRLADLVLRAARP